MSSSPAAAQAAHTPATVLIAGATGLIGLALVRHCLTLGDTVHALARREPSPTISVVNPQSALNWHLVDWAATPGGGLQLPKADIALCALGTTIKTAGSQAAFRAVDLDAVVAFAHAAKTAGATRLGVVSSLGASRRSNNFYSRVKGEMEEAVSAVGFERVVLARPSLLAGDRAALGQATRLGERLTLAVTAPLKGLIPAAWRPVHAAQVAKALRSAVQCGGLGVRVLSSAEMQQSATTFDMS
jgi:uncharacterized protein YbjT (DUF2867 family)